MDPSNVFKDAVDRLSQGAMTALNGWRTPHSQFTIANLCTRFLSSIDDGSFNVSKDAVDGLFQNIMKALNGSNDIPWGFFTFIWHLILRCNCQQTCTLSCLPQMDEGSFKWLQRSIQSIHITVMRVFCRIGRIHTVSAVTSLSRVRHCLSFFDRFTRWRKSDGVPTWFQISEVVSVA